MRALAREYMEAYNRQDIPALLALHTPDAMIITGDSDTISGREQMAKRYEDCFTRYDGALLMRYIDLNWSDEQQAWVARGIYEGYGATYVYDILYHGVTAYTNTIVEEDGRWRIARSTVTPLVRTMVYQKVKNAAEWKSALLSLMHGTGVLTHEMGVLQNAPDTAYALLQWSSLEAAQALFAQPAWQNALRRARGGQRQGACGVVFLKTQAYRLTSSH